VVVACLALGGCDEGHQSVFDSQTTEGDRIATLGWVMIAIATVVFVLVLALMVRALVGRRHTAERTSDPWAPPERRFLLSSKGWILTGGIVVPTAVILVLSALTVDTLNAGSGRPAVEIRVIGHQYWWEVDYPAAGFQTANEIHIPVGQTTELQLNAQDVIHTLWVPELGPKRDMIPGHTTSLVWKPQNTGTFRGQCAEYCGLQHANMALRVVVDTPEDFAAWTAAQAQPAAPPSGSQEQHGQEVFLTLPCSSCHQIRGVNSLPEGITLRDGSFIIGPDLTHVGSRPALAAETIPNDPGQMAQWIADAQLAKPGSLMPAITISDGDLADLVAYLESLR
jgi:cytochrome c oxidase subunit 2